MLQNLILGSAASLEFNLNHMDTRQTYTLPGKALDFSNTAFFLVFPGSPGGTALSHKSERAGKEIIPSDPCQTCTCPVSICTQ